MGVVEEFSGIDVDMLQLRKNKQLLFLTCFCICVRYGLASEFVVDNET